MHRKQIENLYNSSVEKRSKNDVINDLIVELGRDGLDGNSVRELIRGLTQKYPCNDVVIKLGEALGIEQEEQPEQSSNSPVHAVHRVENTVAGYAADRGGYGLNKSDTHHVTDTLECASTDFYKAIGRIILCFLNIEQSKIEDHFSESI